MGQWGFTSWTGGWRAGRSRLVWLLPGLTLLWANLHIEEWFSPNFHLPLAWPLAVYWLALLGVLALSRRQVRVTEPITGEAT